MKISRVFLIILALFLQVVSVKYNIVLWSLFYPLSMLSGFIMGFVVFDDMFEIIIKNNPAVK